MISNSQSIFINNIILSDWGVKHCARLGPQHWFNMADGPHLQIIIIGIILRAIYGRMIQ